jgi:hypothetical protein
MCGNPAPESAIIKTAEQAKPNLKAKADGPKEPPTEDDD